ncbi:transcriptional repressor [bacterium SCSIO 12696]|nr:transcriptional repressor [bacterium SCSIO 12696]
MITNSKLAYHDHDHERCISAALVRAAAVCEQHNARFTQARKDVLSLLWQSHQPLGAYKIMDLLSEKRGKRVMPPTVYRALDFLLELGLIHRIASLNAYIGCPFPGSSHKELFLICRICGSAAEYSADNVSDAITTAAQHANFQLESQSLELMGICPKCR